LTFSDLNLFLHFCWHKKQKIYAYQVFQKYRLKNIYSGTNIRVILSITAQSIFAVKASAWARWKGILL
jgi:hypothetical protein